jgi:hypothetical protein
MSSWPGRCAAALATASLGLTLGMVTPADAQRQEEDPAAGAERLIRIGPQALVSEDEHGNVSMVDEPPPDTDTLTVVATLVGATLGGFVAPMTLLPRAVVTGATYVDAVAPVAPAINL